MFLLLASHQFPLSLKFLLAQYVTLCTNSSTSIGFCPTDKNDGHSASGIVKLKFECSFFLHFGLGPSQMLCFCTLEKRAHLEGITVRQPVKGVCVDIHGVFPFVKN